MDERSITAPQEESTEPGSQPAPPPLQPAYFDVEQAPSSTQESSRAESSQPDSSHFEPSQDDDEIVAADPKFESQPASEESAGATNQTRSQAAGPGGQRGRDGADVGDADVGGAAANKRSLKPSVLLLRKA